MIAMNKDGKIIQVKDNETLLKLIKNSLEWKDILIKNLQQEIEKYEKGGKIEELNARIRDLFNRSVVLLYKGKEMNMYNDYVRKYGRENIVIRQYSNGIGMETYLNHIEKDGSINKDNWVDITDMEKW